MPFGPYWDELPRAGGKAYVDQAAWNQVIDNFPNWKGDVNGGGHKLSNVILDGAGSFESYLSPLAIAPGTDSRTVIALTVPGATPEDPPLNRWTFGADAASNFAITRFDDAGVAIDSPVTIDRATGEVSIAGMFSDPTTVKGDLVARTSTALDRLAVGANGQVLTADSAAGSGVKWANPPASSGLIVEFTYNATLTEPPGAAQLRGNSTDLTTATILWLDDQQATGSAISNVYLKLRAGDRLYVQNKDDDTRWNRYQLTGDAVDKGGYIEFPVQWLFGGAPLLEQRVLIACTPSAPPTVPTSRQIIAGMGLTGGGDLSVDRTFTVVPDSSTQRVRVAKNTALQGTRREINFIEGTGITLTALDDAANNRVNLQIDSTGGAALFSASAAGFAWGGDGADGIVNLDGTATYPNFVTTSGSAPNLIYTLIRDVYATTFAVAAGKTLNTANFRIFAQTSVSVDGTVQCNGGNGSLPTGGLNSQQFTTNPGLPMMWNSANAAGGGGAGTAGTGAGAVGSNGANGNTVSTNAAWLISNTGVAGGGGGGGGNSGATNGGAGGNAGNAGTAAASAKAVTLPREPVAGISLRQTNGFSLGSTNQLPYSPIPGSGAGGGGGAGAGDGTSSGGSGGVGGGAGGGGGAMVISSPSITVGATGVIQCNGGTGGNGQVGGTGVGGNAAGGGGGGGGTGGPGGILVLIYDAYTNNGLVRCAGGAGGTGGGPGTSRGTATAPSAGTNGNTGPAGIVIPIRCEGFSNPTTTKGDLLVRNATSITRLGVGSDGQILMADSGTALGVKWAAAPVTGMTDPTTTAGDLIVRDTAINRLGIGANGQVLTVDTSLPSKLKWAAAPGGGSDTPWTVDHDANGFALNNAGKVQVNGISTLANPLLVSTAQTGGTVRSNSTLRLQSLAVGRDVSLQFSDNVANAAEIGMLVGDMYFCTAATERMRITTAGNVGLGGLTNPQAQLAFKWFNSTTGEQSYTYGMDQAMINFYFKTDDGSFYRYLDFAVAGSDRPSAIRFITQSAGGANPVERMRIAHNGNIGIGTASPSSRLSVVHPANSGLWLGQDDTNGYNIYRDGAGNGLLVFYGNQASFSGYGFDYVNGSSVRTRALTIQNVNGNVGIGTASPAAKLQVSRGAIAPSLTFDSDCGAIIGAPADVQIAFGNNPSSPWAAWMQSRQAGNNAWGLAINPLGGNVGIGTASPGSKLDVSGDINCTGAYRVNGTPISGGGVTTQSNVTASRGVGITYQNTTGKPMMVTVTCSCLNSAMVAKTDSGTSPSTIVAHMGNYLNIGGNVCMSFWVLPNNYYKIENQGSIIISYWFEWY